MAYALRKVSNSKFCPVQSLKQLGPTCLLTTNRVSQATHYIKTWMSISRIQEWKLAIVGYRYHQLNSLHPCFLPTDFCFLVWTSLCFCFFRCFLLFQRKDLIILVLVHLSHLIAMCVQHGPRLLLNGTVSVNSNTYLSFDFCVILVADFTFPLFRIRNIVIHDVSPLLMVV